MFYGDDNHGEGVVYTTDGTASGTTPLTDAMGRLLYFSPISLVHSSLVAGVSGTAYFLASDPARVGQYALYKSNGTSESTVQLGTFSHDDVPFGLANADGLIYLWDSHGNGNAVDLWRSDGTPSGTLVVKSNFSYGVSDLTPVGRSVYFQATQSSGAPMLWVSDGTTAGTVALPAGSLVPADPGSGTSVDGASYYAGMDPGHGTELWIVPPSSVPATPMAPTSLQAATAAPGAVELKWTDPAGNTESSLRVERSADPTFGRIDQTTVLTPGTTRWVDSLTAPGTSYYYRVFAANLGGRSIASNVAGVQVGDVSGRVFEDDNYNATPDSGEPGLFATTVYVDLNNNGVLDPGEPSAVTDLQGMYTLGGLTSGSFIIRQVVPAGYRRTTPAGPTPQIVTAGQTAAGPVFGDVPIGNVQMDFAYLLRISQHYGRTGTISDGDLNADGTINFADLLLLAQNYGYSVPDLAASTPTATEEFSMTIDLGVLPGRRPQRRLSPSFWDAGRRKTPR